MKLLFVAALFCCVCSSFGQIDLQRADQLFDKVKDTPLVKMDPEKVDKVRKKVFVKGCGVNLCFALDGSKSLSGGADFQLQKDFVTLVGAIVGADKNSQFAGTVYGFVNDNISKLTKSAEKFLLQVSNAKFPNAPVTFISAGLGFCFAQLDDVELKNDVNKIVLLGDGLSNFGDLTGPLSPVSIAKQWRDLQPNNAICSVAVGFASINAWSAIVGDRALVLEITDWPKLLDILDSLVESVCFRVPPTKAPPTKAPPAKKCPCKCFKLSKKISEAKSFAKASKQCSKGKFSHCVVKPCDFKASTCCHK